MDPNGKLILSEELWWREGETAPLVERSGIQLFRCMGGLEHIEIEKDRHK
jgi:hypothetical protein